MTGIIDVSGAMEILLQKSVKKIIFRYVEPLASKGVSQEALNKPPATSILSKEV